MAVLVFNGRMLFTMLVVEAEAPITGQVLQILEQAELVE
jgi:hypothetical protein